MNLCQNTVCDSDVSKSLVDVVNFQNEKNQVSDMLPNFP